MNEWIDINQKKPPESVWILIGGSKIRSVDYGCYLEGKFVLPDLNYKEISWATHWMPLPEPPKQE